MNIEVELQRLALERERAYETALVGMDLDASLQLRHLRAYLARQQDHKRIRGALEKAIQLRRITGASTSWSARESSSLRIPGWSSRYVLNNTMRDGESASSDFTCLCQDGTTSRWCESTSTRIRFVIRWLFRGAICTLAVNRVTDRPTFPSRFCVRCWCCISSVKRSSPTLPVKEMPNRAAVGRTSTPGIKSLKTPSADTSTTAPPSTSPAPPSR